MKNPLYEELVELGYVPIEELDEELPPEFVLLHLKNLSQENQRFIIESIDTSIQYLAHQNPSMEQFQDQENAVQFCLTLVSYTPTVIIDDIADIVNPEYPYRFTITGSISTTEEDIPNSVTVSYGNTIAQANFIDGTNKWTLTLDLDTVTSTTLQSLSAVGTVFNIESGEISPESDRVFSEFLVMVLYLLPVEDVQITVEEILTLSCDGGVVAAYIPQSSDGDISSGWGYQQIVINGTAYSPDGSSSTLPPLPLGLLSIGKGRTEYEIEVGSYNYLYFATFENLTAEDLRIELIGIQDAEGHALTVEEQLTLIANPNPTVIVDYSAQKATFCLAKNELL